MARYGTFKIYTMYMVSDAMQAQALTICLSSSATFSHDVVNCLHTHTLCALWGSECYFQAGQSAHFRQNIHNTPTLGKSDSHGQSCTLELWWEQKNSYTQLKLTYQKEYNTNSYIGEDDAHPNFIGQRVQKGEDSWFGFLWLFDHDGDSQRHEGFGEIYHLFTNKSDRQGSNCNICFLMERKRQ